MCFYPLITTNHKITIQFTSKISFNDFQPTSQPVFNTTTPTTVPPKGSSQGKPINYYKKTKKKVFTLPDNPTRATTAERASTR